MKTLNFKYTDTKKLKKFILKNKLQSNKNILVQIFTGICDKEYISDLVKKILKLIPGAKIIGSTTDGIIDNSNILIYETLLSFSIFKSTKIDTFISYGDDANDSRKLGIELASQFPPLNNIKVAICFSDGLHTNGEEFLKGVEQFDKNIVICGGMAADNGKFVDTFVFTDEGITNKGAVCATLSGKELVIHNDYIFGWDRIGKYLTITRSEKNRVYEIDGISAVETYKKYLGKDIEKRLPATGIEFPLILHKEDIDIARAVIKKHDDGSLSFAGNIAEGSKVQFGYGNTIHILKNKNALLKNIIKYPVESIFIYSCMARRRLMGDNIKKEMEVYNDIASVCGFFTYGEFYHHNDGENNTEFLNETKTILTLSERKDKKNKKTDIKYTAIEEDEQLQTINALSHLISQTTKELSQVNRKLSYKVDFELAKTKAILDSNPSIIIVLKEGKIIDANQAFFKFFDHNLSITEWNKKELCICDYAENFGGFESNYIVQKYFNNKYWIDLILENKDTQYKMAIKKDNKLHHFIISVNQYTEEKGAYVIELLDITKDVNFQEQLDEKDQMIIQQSKLAAMGEMISMIAHQWRQPLNALSMAVSSIKLKNDLDILDKGFLDRKLDDISDYSQHLSQTITDFKDFFKPDREKEQIKLDSVIYKLKNIIEDSLINNKISFSIDMEEEEYIVYGYPNELKQVILNLVKNSKDAIVQNKITNGFINIKVYSRNGYYIIEVIDNGGGIDPQIKNKIFEPYFTTKTIDGTGIGLYMSQEIIKKHFNGKLNFNNFNNGTSFKIMLKKEEK